MNVYTGFNIASIHLFAVLLILSSGFTGIISHEVEDAIKSNKFALDFYKSVAKSFSVHDNIAISPFSAEAALAMTFIGARGQTQSEIMSALGIKDKADSDQIGARFRTVNSNQNDYILESANGLFLEKSYEIDPDFRSAIQKSFDANISAVDFATQPEQARRNINSFVEQKTRKRIQNLFSDGSIKTDTKLVLVNAVYFKADWQNQFDAKRTSPLPFLLTNGKNVQVPLMNMEQNIFYTESDDLKSQIVELPYKNGEMNMIIILPREKQSNGIRQLESNLNATSLEQALQELFRQKVKLFLPKFRINTGSDISQDLRNLNIKTAFTNQADLTGISRRKDLKISKAVQKVFVEIDEKGTEAAAATGIQISMLSAVIAPEEVPVFRADHPFLFLIRHRSTNSIIFMGRISDPTAE